jgi:hypothetical protein
MSDVEQSKCAVGALDHSASPEFLAESFSPALTNDFHPAISPAGDFHLSINRKSPFSAGPHRS